MITVLDPQIGVNEVDDKKYYHVILNIRCLYCASVYSERENEESLRDLQKSNDPEYLLRVER